MLTDIQFEQVKKRFPRLASADPLLVEQLVASASWMALPAGQLVASDGQACQHLSLVLSGCVRVYKLAGSGREITLYRIREGDSCVLTASCIMSDRAFPAMAETEGEVEALVLAADKAKQWMATSEVWRSFVLELVARRLGEVIGVVEDLAFHHMDERVAVYLLAMSSESETLQITHQQIAADLGTTREVISRIVKQFDERGWLQAGRGAITLQDRAALQHLGEMR